MRKLLGRFVLPGLICANLHAGAATQVVALGYNLGPVPDGLTNVSGVGVFGYSVLALRGDGSVAQWGNNSSDPGVSNLVTVVGGNDHVLGFTPQGTISGYGDDSFGEISGFPADLTNAAALTAGYLVSFAIRPDGSVVGVGYPENPALLIPSAASNVVAIASEGENGIALRADGTIVDWQYNTTNLHPEFSNVVSVATDGYEYLALFYDGTVAEWPDAAPDGLTNLIAIAGGGNDFLGLQNGGIPVGWGQDNHGELEFPPNLTNVTAFAVDGSDGYSHSIFLIGGTNAPPPTLNIQQSGGMAHVRLNGAVRHRYVLEESTDLTSPTNWAFKRNILLCSPSQSVDLPIGSGPRFYRARVMP